MRQLCRFCLKRCDKDNNARKIDEIIAEILNILLLELNLVITEKPTLCGNCTEVLQKCFDFKSTCFYTEEFIFPQGDSGLKLDLRELFITKQNLAALEISPNQGICRFCLELVMDESCTPLCSVDENMLRKCVPELRLEITNDPVICEACDKLLKDYASFVDMCLETEETIKKYQQTNGLNRSRKVAITKVQKFSVENNQYKLKTPTEHEDIKPVKPEKIHYAECFLRPEDYVEKGKIEHKTKRKRAPNEYHYTKEEAKRKKFACTICSYRTSCKSSHTKHALIHMDPSDLEWFSCDVCTYKSINKFHIARHMLTHDRKPNKIVFRKCHICDYRARYPSTLKKHIRVVHGDDNKLKMYRCEHCSYKSRYERSLEMHVRKHEKKYKHQCEMCSFKTKYIESFRRHLRRHKDPSELQFLRCDKCDYKTIYKQRLGCHIMSNHTNQRSESNK